MNVETVLRRITEGLDSSAVYIGNVCYIDMGGKNKLKVTSEPEAHIVELLNTFNGKVDSYRTEYQLDPYDPELSDDQIAAYRKTLTDYIKLFKFQPKRNDGEKKPFVKRPIVTFVVKPEQIKDINNPRARSSKRVQFAIGTRVANLFLDNPEKQILTMIDRETQETSPNKKIIAFTDAHVSIGSVDETGHWDTESITAAELKQLIVENSKAKQQPADDAPAAGGFPTEFFPLDPIA